MNVKYTHTFKGLDDVTNRFEILTNEATTPREVLCTRDAFSLDYINSNKLDTVRGSQATISLLSTKVFEFTNLHTDDMQSHLVKFYRNGAICWCGWLDSELYNEKLSDYPPYPVEFSAADFNIWERLKYRDENEKSYADVASMIIHLRRCFDKLNLPFANLYIGCTTTANGISLSDAETVLHKLYVQSSNFYDEDNEPMTCREVVDSILKPFGLTMIQKDGDVYIYDLNVVYQPTYTFKKYRMSDWNYIGSSSVNLNIGNLNKNSFRDTSGDYGFEEMANNVTITSSLYAESSGREISIDADTVTEEFTPSHPQTDTDYYKKSEGIENVSDGYFVLYHDRVAGLASKASTLGGSFMLYSPSANLTTMYRVHLLDYITRIEHSGSLRTWPYYINIQCSAYPSTNSQPLMHPKVDNIPNSGVLKLFCNLFLIGVSGEVDWYYSNINSNSVGWKSGTGGVGKGQFVLWYSHSDISTSVLDDWQTNSDIYFPMDNREASILEELVGKGVHLPPEQSGRLVFEITNKSVIQNPKNGAMVDSSKIPMILINNIKVSIVSMSGDDVSTDDYEFKSYINKGVSSDYPEIELKCISANEDGLPIGRGNILKYQDNSFSLQTKFTRAGQTDILERLLMVTIHSNHSRKNQMFTTTIAMDKAINPLGYITYTSVLQGKFLVTGCSFNFSDATTTMNVVEYSNDVDKLSNIPYE